MPRILITRLPFFLSLFFVFSSITNAQTTISQEKVIDGKTYTLDFYDEFDDTQINWEKWKYRGKGISPKRIFATDGVELDGQGNLIMTAYSVLRESLPEEFVNQFKGKWVPAVTNIRTQKEFTFGYHEVRLKMPIVKGFGMAVWLQSDGQTRKPSSPDPKVGAEIDIIEQTFFDRYGQPNDYKHSTIHWGGYGNTHQFVSVTVAPKGDQPEQSDHQDEELNLVKNKITQNKKGQAIPENLIREKWTYYSDKLNFRDDAFHTVAVLWTPEYYKFYYDGQCIGTLKQGVSHAPGYMIFWPRMFNFLDLVGNTEEGAGDLHTSKAKYVIDYYRVYQAK